MHSHVVSVDKVSFSYNQVDLPVNNVSFKSFSSQILAIVGPSGCGKTTLIKLILSLLPLHSGSIKIFGRDKCADNIDVPGQNVGYMPQEEALPTDMMVKECLYFYALLNKINNNIAQRIDEVLRDFELFDHRWNFVSTLSGGMRRRLSLGIALLHRPKLLILDEPSVGADPVLREKIWRILDQSRKNDQCIIMTTHYLDECRHADNILVIKKGRKLAEGPADDILQKLNARSLDDAYLELCSSPEYQKESLELFCYPNVCSAQTPLSCKKSSRSANFFVILALCYRFMHSFLFNPVALICLLVLSGYAVKVCELGFNDKPDHIPIGFVVENQTIYQDKSLLGRFNVTPRCLDCIHPKYFANYVDSNAIDLVKYSNFEDAVNDIKSTKIRAAIYFNAQFGDAFLRRLVSDQSTLDDYTIRNSKILLEADTVSNMLYSWIEAMLFDAYEKYTRGSRANLNLKPIPLYPMEAKDSVVGDIKIKDRTSFDSYLFSLILNTIFPTSIYIGGLPVLVELTEKSAQRYFSTGITPNCLFIAATLVTTVLLSLSGYCGIIYAFWMRSLHTNGSHILASTIIFSQCLVGTLFGQIIALQLKSVSLLGGVSIADLMMAFSCQGILISIEAQPYYLQWISYYLPNSLPLESLKAIYLRELGIKSPKVYNGFIACLAYIFCLSLISRRCFSKLTI